MANQQKSEVEYQLEMLERVGILPVMNRYESKHFDTWTEEATLLPPLEVFCALLAESFTQQIELKRPLKDRIDQLEKEMEELKKNVAPQKQLTRADLVYYKHKDELEETYRGKIVAIDIDSESIVSIGDSVLDAYKKAIEKSQKRKFSYRRIGYDSVHKV